MKINLRITAITLGIAAVIALGISYFSKLSFIAAFALVAFGILVNGSFATLEDEMPGGFNNPDGENGTPAAAKRIRFYIIVGAGILALYVIWVVAKRALS